MKKAILLLEMAVFVLCILLFVNADATTVLIDKLTSDYSAEQSPDDTDELLYVEPENVSASETMPVTGAETIVMTEVAGQTQSQAETVADNGVEEAAVVTTNGGYAYSMLSEEEQQVYAEILASLSACEEKTTLTTKNSAIIEKAFHCVMYDHPEIFYVDGYNYTEYSRGSNIEKIVFSGDYLYDEEQIGERRVRIEEAAEQILAGVPQQADEYQVVKYIYETIVRNTEYDLESEDNQNICSVFLNGRSVCQGYAKAMQYLLQKMGMEALLVTGNVRDGDGHAWNLVSVNGNWYYLDATWGDAYYLLGGDSPELAAQRSSAVNYDYLCVTTEQITKTHIIDMPIALPECTASQDNYYVREDLYFEHYDEERIRNLFTLAVGSGKDTVTIKCSDSAVYSAVCTELLNNQKVFEFYHTADGTIAYTDNPEQNSITFWL